jgi:hypothetical protein
LLHIKKEKKQKKEKTKNITIAHTNYEMRGYTPTDKPALTGGQHH